MKVYDMKEKIFRAGLIPYIVNENGVEMLFMKPANPKYGGSHYQLAKGKLENGESNEEAAIREGEEELGFTKLNMDGSVMELGNFLGRTYVYVVKVKNKNLFTKPHFETSNTKWMTEETFLDEGRGLHKHIIKAAQRMIVSKDEKFKEK